MRSDIKVGIGGGISDPVLDPGTGIGGTADHTKHRSAVSEPPTGAIGRQRVGPVTLVPVDGRCGQQTGGTGVGQDTGQELKTGGRQAPLQLTRDKRIAGIGVPDQRLMKVPTT